MAEHKTVTMEIYKITKDIARGKSWEYILMAHCKRTDTAMPVASEMKMTYDFSYKDFYYNATWKKQSFTTGAYDTEFTAREELYQKIVKSILAKEMNKVRDM